MFVLLLIRNDTVLITNKDKADSSSPFVAGWLELGRNIQLRSVDVEPEIDH